jgi:ketoreductase RED1
MPQGQQDILNRYGKTAIIGAGVIGASWTALFLAHGLEVVVNDPRPDVEALVRDYIRNNLSTLEALGLPTANLEAKLRFEADLENAVAGADLVQENGPERIEFKRICGRASARWSATRRFCCRRVQPRPRRNRR